MKYWRYRTAEGFIYHAILREISYLGSAAEISNGRQEKVLHDRPQHDPGTEPSRFRIRKVRQFVTGKLILSTPRSVTSVGSFAERDSSAVLVMPKKREITI